ncbi:DUF3052 domain-containing protein [Nocardioides anomalus]|uniref:DUF3052 domain-containing protein n=1 Tax=Nocardioides anomalus TaxID=2712223 RepID=A0A6G6W8P7_9ACTN|nr:DUF3052 domain-containing protein [Nocardioides anomalus]QIG41527.1 DUF3052 domain-containing protein [Nocardioides anomalus]
MTLVAGSSGTPLVRKLGIGDEHVVFLDGAPLDLELGDTGGAHVVHRLPRRADVTLTFHTSRAALGRRLPVLFERTTTAGMVWVCWPKKAAQKARGIDSDLDGDQVRRLGLALGFVDVLVAALDETWSGQKFVRRLRDR